MNTTAEQNISIEDHQLTVASIVNEYIQGMTLRNVASIEKIFYKEARMLYAHHDVLVDVPVFPSLTDYITKTPSDPQAYGRILHIEVGNTTAYATVEVISNGSSFTDYFILLFTNAEWKIVTKVFSVAAKTLV